MRYVRLFDKIAIARVRAPAPGCSCRRHGAVRGLGCLMAFALGLGMSTSVLAVGKDENLAPAEFHADTAQQLLVTYDLGTAAGAGSFNAGAAAGKRHPVTEQLAQRYGMTPIKEWPLDVLGRLCVVFRKAQGQSIDALAAELRKDARVRSVQGIHQYYATSSSR